METNHILKLYQNLFSQVIMSGTFNDKLFSLSRRFVAERGFQLCERLWFAMSFTQCDPFAWIMMDFYQNIEFRPPILASKHLKTGVT